VVARIGGFWWLNACRIVYTIDEPRRERVRLTARSRTPPTEEAT